PSNSTCTWTTANCAPSTRSGSSAFRSWCCTTGCTAKAEPATRWRQHLCPVILPRSRRSLAPGNAHLSGSLPPRAIATGAKSPSSRKHIGGWVRWRRDLRCGAMSGDPQRQRLAGADVVRDAAVLSLAADGVRAGRFRVREADCGWTQPSSWELGVADPAVRSVHWRHVLAEDSPWVKLGEAVVRRWPRLDDDDPPDEQGSSGHYETI